MAKDTTDIGIDPIPDESMDAAWEAQANRVECDIRKPRTKITDLMKHVKTPGLSENEERGNLKGA